VKGEVPLTIKLLCDTLLAQNSEDHMKSVIFYKKYALRKSGIVVAEHHLLIRIAGTNVTIYQ
jgi:hypothetical protein